MNEFFTKEQFARQGLKTPAFVYAEQTIIEDAQRARDAISDTNSHLLYAVKTFSVISGLETIAACVDGFHVSSLFEAKLARQLLGTDPIVHITTPALRPDEAEEIFSLCDYVSFNSLSQWQTFKASALGKVNCGLRINPQLKLIADDRYDPCRDNSKLGVPLRALTEYIESQPQQFHGINGILFHSNCDSTDLLPLLQTVQHLHQHLQPLLKKLDWINLGGGYLFSQSHDLEYLHTATAFLHEQYNVRLLFEPGAALIRRAGYIVASVVDMFSNGDNTMAVLDTSVNHMPEVFEYQFQQDVMGDSEQGNFCYQLAGATCLAGDLFGEYCFVEPLTIGSYVVFTDIGAYSQVKANMFNGINLPNIYALNAAGEFILKKAFTYADFLSLNGDGRYAHI